MRDLPRLAPTWVRVVVAMWAAVVVIVLVLLVLRLILGRR